MFRLLIISTTALVLSLYSPILGQGWWWQHPLPQGNKLRTMDAVDADHVWFGTSAGVVLHSSDGGMSWQLQQTPSHAYITGIDFVDTEYGWTVGRVEEGGFYGVLFHTQDGGATWQEQHLRTDAPVPDVAAVEFLDRQHGWVVGSSGFVFHTRDGGQSWQEQKVLASDGFFRNLRDVSVIDSSHVWIAGEYVVAHTEDGGQVWHVDTTNVGYQVFEEVFFVDEGHGWLLTDPNAPKLYKTTDGGKHWTSGNGNLTADIFHVFFLSPDTGWVDTDKGVYWTTDGGEEWQQLSAQTVGDFVFLNEAVAWSGAGISISRTGNSIFRTIDGGQHWEELTESLTSPAITLQAVDFVDSEMGWTVGNAGTILATKDGGRSWEKQKSQVNTRLTDVMFLNKKLGWVCGFTGTILRTRDGGASWELLEEIPGRNPHRAIFFADSLTGWVVGGDVLEDGWIRYTKDGGETWVEQTPGVITRMFDVYFHDKNLGWVIGDGGQIWNTQNGGESWQQQNSGIGTALGVLEFTDASNGWILTGESVLHTMDGGEKWQEIKIDTIRQGLRDISFADENHAWIVGVTGVLFYTEDGGQTWTEIAGATTNTLQAVDFVNKKTGWVVGNWGTILYTSTGGVTSVEAIPTKGASIPAAFHLYPNYPNPFNPETNIRFEVKKPQAKVSLIIFDVLGRKVSELVHEQLPEGTYELTWDGHNENGMPSPSGVYFAHLQVDGQTQTRKMLLLR